MNQTDEIMKAIVYRQYGSPEVLRVEEVAKPVPTDDEVLIKIRAAAVTAADTMMRSGKPYIGRLVLGLTKPKRSIPGTEFSGEIVEAGRNVKLFKIGDPVFGSTDTKFGAYAEYICLPETDVMAIKPQKLTHEEAVAVNEGFMTALPFLRDTGNIQQGQKILINGASGAVGSSAVQLAKYFGAEVTAVCSTANLELVKSLGADRVLDYTKEDFTKSGEIYDIIFDTVGKSSFNRSKCALKADGQYLSTVLSFKLLWQMMWTSKFSRKKAKFAATGLRAHQEKIKDLAVLNEFVEKGFLKPVIDKRFPIEQVVEAHRYVSTGHKKGNLILCMESG